MRYAAEPFTLVRTQAEKPNQSAKIVFGCEADVPKMFSYWFDNLTVTDDEQERWFEMHEEAVKHRLLGHSDNIQGSMEDECALVTSGIHCGGPEGYQSPEAQNAKKHAADWVLLLQISTEDNALNLEVGDGGSLYLWIKKQDLAEQKFENARLIAQCY